MTSMSLVQTRPVFDGLDWLVIEPAESDLYSTGSMPSWPLAEFCPCLSLMTIKLVNLASFGSKLNDFKTVYGSCNLGECNY